MDRGMTDAGHLSSHQCSLHITLVGQVTLTLTSHVSPSLSPCLLAHVHLTLFLTLS